MPAANHSYYLRNCYLENRLSAGSMVLDNTLLDLSKVKVPVYNLATREDHIAPAESVLYGSQFFGGPVKYVLSGSGHIAGVVNPPAAGKYQYWTNDNIKDVTLARLAARARRSTRARGGRTGAHGSRASTPSRCRRAPSAATRCRRSRTRPAATCGSAPDDRCVARSTIAVPAQSDRAFMRVVACIRVARSGRRLRPSALRCAYLTT